MWDEEDGFFYDVLRFPDGEATRLKVRSMVGLLPLCAAATFEPSTLERLSIKTRLQVFSTKLGILRLVAPLKGDEEKF